MKVRQLLQLGFREGDLSSPSPSSSTSSSSSSLTISFKRLRAVAPKKLSGTKSITPLADLKGINSLNPNHSLHNLNISPVCHVMVQSGGTRWNPTQEQIKALEGLYHGGMRTPKANQIETITSDLRRYGRIEGKNVFYWFQNHKARERQKQKQKRSAILTLTQGEAAESMGREDCNHDESCKRKCRRWDLGFSEDGGYGSDGTLKLFPLHPDGGNI